MSKVQKLIYAHCAYSDDTTVLETLWCVVMKDIQVDQQGQQRCWNCGGRQFTHKRTFRSKAIGVTAGIATVGVAALGTLATAKKLKCQRCGEYNKTGSAESYQGPANRKYRKEWKAEQQATDLEQQKLELERQRLALEQQKIEVETLALAKQREAQESPPPAEI